MLNTGKTEEARGAGCAKNEFMYMVANHGIHKYNADVIIIENAPALATNKGKPVADRLFKIASENGYSLTLYKTSTMFHGIPQKRPRCFAVLWKSVTAPKMSYYKRDRKDFLEYLQEIKPGALHHDVIINPKVANEPFYDFIRAKFRERNPRDVISESGNITAFNYVNKSGLLDECLQYFRDTKNELGIKLAEHAVKKFSQGLGIWDGSAHVFTDVMNSCIGRNMADTIHPLEDRSLTIREAMHIMGLPENFELVGGKKNCNMIAQNVPTTTARDMCLEAIKFLEGKLSDSGHDYFVQCNYNEKEDSSRSTVEQEEQSLEEFFTI